MGVLAHEFGSEVARFLSSLLLCRIFGSDAGGLSCSRFGSDAATLDAGGQLRLGISILLSFLCVDSRDQPNVSLCSGFLACSHDLQKRRTACKGLSVVDPPAVERLHHVIGIGIDPVTVVCHGRQYGRDERCGNLFGECRVNDSRIRKNLSGFHRDGRSFPFSANFFLHQRSGLFIPCLFQKIKNPVIAGANHIGEEVSALIFKFHGSGLDVKDGNFNSDIRCRCDAMRRSKGKCRSTRILVGKHGASNPSDFFHGCLNGLQLVLILYPVNLNNSGDVIIGGKVSARSHRGR